MVSASKCTATARYWLCAPSSFPIWALSCSTKRAAGTESPGAWGCLVGGAQAARRTLSPFLAFTSLRFLTVYPSGSVPSASIRIGHRLQRGLSTQHFDLGFLGTEGR